MHSVKTYLDWASDTTDTGHVISIINSNLTKNIATILDFWERHGVGSKTNSTTQNVHCISAIS